MEKMVKKLLLRDENESSWDELKDNECKKLKAMIKKIIAQRLR